MSYSWATKSKNVKSLSPQNCEPNIALLLAVSKILYLCTGLWKSNRSKHSISSNFWSNWVKFTISIRFYAPGKVKNTQDSCWKSVSDTIFNYHVVQCAISTRFQRNRALLCYSEETRQGLDIEAYRDNQRRSDLKDDAEDGHHIIATTYPTSFNELL